MFSSDIVSGLREASMSRLLSRAAREWLHSISRLRWKASRQTNRGLTANSVTYVVSNSCWLEGERLGRRVGTMLVIFFFAVVHDWRDFSRVMEDVSTSQENSRTLDNSTSTTCNNHLKVWNSVCFAVVAVLVAKAFLSRLWDFVTWKTESIWGEWWGG